MKRRKLEDYEEIILKYKEEVLSVACCDCGLVHKMGFHIYRGGVLGIAHLRDNRATAQLRRHKYGDLQKGKSKYRMEIK